MDLIGSGWNRLELAIRKFKNVKFLLMILSFYQFRSLTPLVLLFPSFLAKAAGADIKAVGSALLIFQSSFQGLYVTHIHTLSHTLFLSLSFYSTHKLFGLKTRFKDKDNLISSRHIVTSGRVKFCYFTDDFFL